MDNSIQNTYNSYPHPVLGNANDIEFSTILISAQIRLNKGYEFKIIVDINDDESDYIELINNKDAYLSIMLDCPETLYTRYYKFYEIEPSISIPFEHICGKIEITCYIVTENTINDKFFPNQNQLFEDSKFNINRSEWLGVSNTIVHYIDPQFKKNLNKNNSSIFEIVKDKENKYKGIYKPHFNHDHIYIYISNKIYDKWYEMNDSKRFLYITLYSLIIPVTAEAIDIIESEGNYEFKLLKWYVVLSEELKKDKYTNDQSSLQKAQIVFERQFGQLIEQMYDFYENF